MTFSFDIPDSMNALMMMDTGPAGEVLKYTRVKTPSVTHPREMLVNVIATSVNPSEARIRSGDPAIEPLEKVPAILGCDYAGVVVAKGVAVEGFEVGDAVYGTLGLPFGRDHGTYAEYAMIQGVDSIAKKPDPMTFEEAAAVGFACSAAYEALVVVSYLTDTTAYYTGGPKRVIILDASSGVGTFAVQIAKAHGAHVVAVCRGKDGGDLIHNLGADRVVDCTQKVELDALAQEAGAYDVVLDTINSDHYFRLFLPVLRFAGIYTTIAGPGMNIGSHRFGVSAIVNAFGVTPDRARMENYVSITTLPRECFSTEIHPLLADGKVKSVLREDQIFYLKNGAMAHELMETDEHIGKIIIRISA